MSESEREREIDPDWRVLKRKAVASSKSAIYTGTSTNLGLMNPPYRHAYWSVS